MLESITEDGPEDKAFKIFCLKNPEYVMNIMAAWMALKELIGADSRRQYKARDGQSLISKFKYWQPFGVQFHYTISSLLRNS